jgi:hypothetical protein
MAPIEQDEHIEEPPRCINYEKEIWGDVVSDAACVSGTETVSPTIEHIKAADAAAIAVDPPTPQPENIIVQSIALSTDHGTLAVLSPDEGITVYRILKEHWPDLKGQIIITL